ncbi:retention module-containing protein, partial [Dechloromonas denitrificans]|uniref:retention module-containing protein n=1 Tax=Dechloromonas denitrificans TaxID=281362 RepID=UPI001969FDFC
MAQAQVIAQVSALSGEAFARDSAGNLRRLKVGDAIREGESVVAGEGAHVMLRLADGRDMMVRPGEVAKLDAEVAAPVKPDATDSAVVNNQKGFEKIAKALTAGGDLDALLEDPAAGIAGPGGNEGHTFVEFLRVVETVDPLAFQFSTERGRPLETIDGGAAQITQSSTTAIAVAASLDAASDSALKGDAITNDNTPTLVGSGTPGATITVLSPTGEVMTTTVAESGVWTVTPTKPLADGPVSFDVTATDAAGNSAKTTVEATIDTQAAGTISVDPITPDSILTTAEAGGTITVSGKVGGDAEAGDLITLTINGKQFTGTVNADRSYAIDVPGSDLAADGDKVVEATVTGEDVAGNVFVATSTQAYVPHISVGDVSVAEGSPAIFTVTLDSAYSVPALMQLALGNTAASSDVDATAGVDFVSQLYVSFDAGQTWSQVGAGGQISVPAGITTYHVGIPTNADEPGKVYEGSETFTLSASFVGGSQVSTGLGTIFDDGTSGTPTPLPGPTPFTTPLDDRPTFNLGSDVIVDEAA